MITVSLVGFGQIGKLILKNAVRRGFEIKAVVDINPQLHGKDAGEEALGEKLGVKVTSDIEEVMGSDLVFHATGSYLDQVFEQLVQIVKMGSNILSTAETLSYPWKRYPVLSKMLDNEARLSGVTVLGAGINPGFLLDTLPAVLSAPISGINRIQAVRMLEPLKRRPAFQKKIGLGMGEEEYREKLSKGELTGHVGYLESVYIIMQVLGREPEEAREWQEPVTAEEDIVVDGRTVVSKGRVKGVVGGAKAISGNLVVEAVFKAYVGAGEGELVRIEGEEQSIEWRSTGTHGDHGTAAIIASLAETIVEAEPGLLTMADLIPFRPR